MRGALFAIWVIFDVPSPLSARVSLPTRIRKFQPGPVVLFVEEIQ
jgi:hypothetical protein